MLIGLPKAAGWPSVPGPGKEYYRDSEPAAGAASVFRPWALRELASRSGAVAATEHGIDNYLVRSFILSSSFLVYDLGSEASPGISIPPGYRLTTGVGVLRWVVVPSPSRPSWLSPQHLAVLLVMVSDRSFHTDGCPAWAPPAWAPDSQFHITA